MPALSLWSVRIAFGAALVLAAAAVGGVLGGVSGAGPDLRIVLGLGFVALAFALRRCEAFAAWALGGGCVVYGVLGVWLGGAPLSMAIVGVLLGIFLWAALQLQRRGVRVPWSETWARVAMSLALLHVGIDAGWVLNGRPYVTNTLPALIFQMLLMGMLALGVWRRWPWAAYALVAWEVLGVMLTIRTPREAALHAVQLALYAVGAYHVQKLARTPRAADPSRRRTLADRLAGRATSR